MNKQRVMSYYQHQKSYEGRNSRMIDNDNQTVNSNESSYEIINRQSNKNSKVNEKANYQHENQQTAPTLHSFFW